MLQGRPGALYEEAEGKGAYVQSVSILVSDAFHNFSFGMLALIIKLLSYTGVLYAPGQLTPYQ
jgi:hypothetical protein